MVIKRNPWGSTQNSFYEPQRSDLWVLDLTEVVNTLNTNSNTPAVGLDAEDYRFFAISVTLPTLEVQPQIIHRGTVPVNNPGYDVPVSSVDITFIDDASHVILQLLNKWRDSVRAGREAQTLLANFKLPRHRFDLTLHYLKGQASPEANAGADEALLPDSLFYVLANAWLGKIKMGDMAYEGTKINTISATIYPERITIPDRQPGNLF